MHEWAPLCARKMKNMHILIKLFLTFCLKRINKTTHEGKKQVKGKQVQPVDELQPAWQEAEKNLSVVMKSLIMMAKSSELS